MSVPWEIDADKVETVVQKIIEVAKPKKLILFGSYARGVTHRDSDLDFLVVTSDEIDNPRKESARILRCLRGLHVLADIVVVPESVLRKLADAPGLIYREALRTGRVLYEAT